MDIAKKKFVETEALQQVKNLQSDSPALWGKMNAQQMLEHLSDFFDVSSQKITFPLVTPEEQLPLYRAFLLSDKEFRENTKAPSTIIGEEPFPIRYPSLDVAKEKLQEAIESFSHYFSTHPEAKTQHPVFGWLNYEDWILLHYKHVQHHLKQFNLLS